MEDQEKLNEAKYIIRKLLQVFVIELDENGERKASIKDQLDLVNEATKLIKEDNQFKSTPYK